eukprot:NODE_9794_length_356_cov_38.091205_g8887_i0.p2 GENE.NODE_9794_length_356_cov_38.091205_g8887_i0~~NODE_9794_length_356_cov_38.091205_g8887_i0.p2  ORF type:complete len:77 (+),score=31.34 NODE_9794_length_356_cov_38.091205_g8887_i0:26-232(+)
MGKQGCRLSGLRSVTCHGSTISGTGSLTEDSRLCVAVAPYWVDMTNEEAYNMAAGKLKKYGVSSSCSL